MDIYELQTALGVKSHATRHPNKYITQRPNGCFQVQKKIKGKLVHLGYAKTIEIAREKRDKALELIAKMEQNNA